tara:strand:+ start:1312 stop:1980 length:669 start_codon:yes stop_codon:yes gene_type:complete
MRIESKLCHVSENKVVVQVNGWINEKNLGSALAEGPTVEIAEDRAILRLNKRVNEDRNDVENITPVNEDQIKTLLKDELPKSEKIEKININYEPSDWSNELIAIDSEIKRLKWNRDDEIKFLEKNLGYNSRNKIIKYNDIVKYLSLLKKTNEKNSSNIVKENVNILIEESDSILRDLSWDNIQGREFLQKEFKVSTRKELNEKQLLLFVEKLKIIRNQFQTR